MDEAAHKAIADIEAGRQVVCTMEEYYATVRMALQRYAMAQAAQGTRRSWRGSRRRSRAWIRPRRQAGGPGRIAHVGNGCWCGWGDGMRPASWDGATTGVRMGSRPHRHREGGR